MALLRRLGILASLLAVLAAGTAIAAFVRGHIALHPRGAAAPAMLAVAPAPTLVERGEHLAAIACAGCHTHEGQSALSGGGANVFVRASEGRVFAPNLTPGGVLAAYSDAELARAFREGLGRDGRVLLGMPAANGLDDRDAAALVAFLRAQPAILNEVRSRRISWSTTLRAGAGLFAPRLPALEGGTGDSRAAFTVTHGRWVASLAACASCHGADLRGGRPGPFTPAPGGDLVAFASRQNLQAFDEAVRRGVSPDGTVLDRGRMPFAAYAHLDDTEVGALYTFLQSSKTRR